MGFYRCNICDEEGNEVAHGVTVTVDETTMDESTQWFGTITDEHVEQLTAGHTYRLHFEDGRTGEFRVRRNTMAGEETRAVSIRGTGPLKRTQ